MKIVVDTNIVFSAILNTNSRIGDLILNSQGVFEYYSCYLLHEELENHKDKILQLSACLEEELERIKMLIFEKIHFISEEIIPYEYWQKALPLVRDVDMDDIAFVALSHLLDANLWTGDNKLIKELRAKGFENVVSTDELLQVRYSTE